VWWFQQQQELPASTQPLSLDRVTLVGLLPELDSLLFVETWTIQLSWLLARDHNHNHHRRCLDWCMYCNSRIVLKSSDAPIIVCNSSYLLCIKRSEDWIAMPHMRTFTMLNLTIHYLHLSMVHNCVKQGHNSAATEVLFARVSVIAFIDGVHRLDSEWQSTCCKWKCCSRWAIHNCVVRFVRTMP
jgi:hypothetical protein